MNIGIVYDVARSEERLLIDATRKLGHDVTLIHLPKEKFWLGHADSFTCDVFFQRCLSLYRALASTVILEQSGYNVINSFNTIRDCADKLVTTAKLSSAGVPVPETVVTFSKDVALETSKSMGYPVVVKPIYGSWGRMVSRALDDQNLLDILDINESMPNAYLKVHYIQQYVDKPGRDIRSFYIWGEVPVAIYRVSSRWKTNTALGAKAEPAPVTDQLREVTLKAGEALGGGVLGVDLLESPDGGLLVSEVNGIIEFRNTVRVTGYDLARKIVEETVKVFKR